MEKHLNKYWMIYINILIIIITVLLTSNYYKKIINTKPQIETTVRVDTVYVEKTVKDTIPILKEKIIKETTVDTLYVYLNDTIKVYLPVEIPLYSYIYQNEIKQDETLINYKAFLSGYRASLDSIDITLKYPEITKETIIKETYNQKGTWNYNIGIGIGYGLFNKKPDAYIGVGFGYTF